MIVIGNAVILFYVTIYPGFQVSDQSAIPANTKGMFTFDGQAGHYCALYLYTNR